MTTSAASTDERHLPTALYICRTSLQHIEVLTSVIHDGTWVKKGASTSYLVGECTFHPAQVHCKCPHWGGFMTAGCFQACISLSKYADALDERGPDKPIHVAQHENSASMKHCTYRLNRISLCTHKINLKAGSFCKRCAKYAVQYIIE